MLFYLHYCLMTSGLSGTSVLLAVFFKTYTDASQAEIGALLMTFPFVSLIIKPLFCSMADRHQAHRLYLLLAIIVEMLGYTPFMVIPFFPAFYTHYPRISWYVLVVACHVGNGGLGVAWSLGDCLAVNYSQKTGTPFGRMRLMGTLSWGVYGFIIGQINELPALPKYLPAFIILHLSLVLELIMIFLWNKDDFVMFDPLAGLGAQADQEGGVVEQHKLEQQQQQQLQLQQNFSGEKELEAMRASRTTLNKMGGGGGIAANYVDSSPSSLSGTLRINPKSANAFRDLLASSDAADELQRRFKQIELQQQQLAGDAKLSKEEEGQGEGEREGQRERGETKQQDEQKQGRQGVDKCARVLVMDEANLRAQNGVKLDRNEKLKIGANETKKAKTAIDRKNPQLILLKMILLEDGRVIKYALLFTIFGILMAPMNFIFLSMEEVSRERGYNFSQLAGAVLISQALIETVAFFVTPWCMRYVTKWVALSAGLIIMSAKYFFYAGWYYNESMSPYWAVLAEWSHGISYGIFCTIQADVALMFANQSRLFIGELRNLGFLSSFSDEIELYNNNAGGTGDKRLDERTCTRDLQQEQRKAQIEAEENSIKMALRATMSSLFSGLMDGLGAGSGALICGVFIEMYSYIFVWQIVATIASVGIVSHLLIELSRSRWSDRYKAEPGTKAYEIMQLNKAAEAKQRAGFDNKRHNNASVVVLASIDQKPTKVGANSPC